MDNEITRVLKTANNEWEYWKETRYLLRWPSNSIKGSIGHRQQKSDFYLPEADRKQQLQSIEHRAKQHKIALIHKQHPELRSVDYT